MTKFMADRLAASTAEAASPHTPPERLRALYSWESPPQLREALARNPNAPGSLLFWLFVEYPNEVAANSALARALQEDPQLLHGIQRDKKAARFIAGLRSPGADD